MNISQINLLVYALCYLGLIFVWRIIRTRKKIKQNPVTYSLKDSAHDYIGKLFLIFLIFHILTVILYVSNYLGLKISYIDNFTINIIGGLLAWGSLIWVLTAQSQMGNDWRLGIDKNKKTYIRTKGLFKFNRHPIYLGVILSSLSLFLIRSPQPVIKPDLVLFSDCLRNFTTSYPVTWGMK